MELKSKLKEWSAPKGREKGHPDRYSDKRKREVNETHAFRINAARLIGTAAKQGLDEDIKDMLSYWGTDPSLKVRDAVAVSLEQCAQDIDEANSALNLMKEWGSGSANDEPSIFRLYATALPLTRFALANSGDAVRLRALAYLRFLARDRRESVRFYTSIAVEENGAKDTLCGSRKPAECVSTRLECFGPESTSPKLSPKPVFKTKQKWRASFNSGANLLTKIYVG